MATASQDDNAPEVCISGALDSSEKEVQARMSYQAHDLKGDEQNSQFRNRRRNPFNLRPLAFGAIAALLSAIIVAAVVGGGLGSTLSTWNRLKRYLWIKLIRWGPVHYSNEKGYSACINLPPLQHQDPPYLQPQPLFPTIPLSMRPK